MVEPLELVLYVFVSLSENGCWEQVLWKSRKDSLMLSHLSNTKQLLFMFGKDLTKTINKTSASNSPNAF